MHTFCIYYAHYTSVRFGLVQQKCTGWLIEWLSFTRQTPLHWDENNCAHIAQDLSGFIIFARRDRKKVFTCVFPLRNVSTCRYCSDLLKLPRKSKNICQMHQYQYIQWAHFASLLQYTLWNVSKSNKSINFCNFQSNAIFL